MAHPPHEASLEDQIETWRNYIRGGSRGTDVDIEGLERRLRAEIAGLMGVGLSLDEAFLVAVKRVGTVEPRAREFAREQSDRVWEQRVVTPSNSAERSAFARKDGLVAFSFAVLAGIAVKVPALFGMELGADAHVGFYLRNASLFVLPCLVAYFVWKRRLAVRTVGWLGGAFVIAALFANASAFGAAPGYAQLTALHVPIALLLAVGIAYTGGRWRELSARMDFIRFSGELFIYYVLIALGGGVLMAFMALTFKSIGVHIETFFAFWLVPCGAAGAVVVASWLVEARQGVLAAMAPVLTRLFTPLFAAMLVGFLATLLFSGRGIAIARELLIGFDLLLVVVLGLLLYSMSARNPQAGPGAFDVVQVVLVVSALLADVVALWAIGARISEFGFTPNRVAALGENVILLVNLAGSAVLYTRFVLGRGSFSSVERWQTAYLPVYAAWAALVVIGFPTLFRAF